MGLGEAANAPLPFDSFAKHRDPLPITAWLKTTTMRCSALFLASIESHQSSAASKSVSKGVSFTLAGVHNGTLLESLSLYSFPHIKGSHCMAINHWSIRIHKIASKRKAALASRHCPLIVQK
jgi:hypothetical protein